MNELQIAITGGFIGGLALTILTAIVNLLVKQYSYRITIEASVWNDDPHRLNPAVYIAVDNRTEEEITFSIYTDSGQKLIQNARIGKKTRWSGPGPIGAIGQTLSTTKDRNYITGAKELLSYLIHDKLYVIVDGYARKYYFTPKRGSRYDKEKTAKWISENIHLLCECDWL